MGQKVPCFKIFLSRESFPEAQPIFTVDPSMSTQTLDKGCRISPDWSRSLVRFPGQCKFLFQILLSQPTLNPCQSSWGRRLWVCACPPPYNVVIRNCLKMKRSKSEPADWSTGTGAERLISICPCMSQFYGASLTQAAPGRTMRWIKLWDKDF